MAPKCTAKAKAGRQHVQKESTKFKAGKKHVQKESEENVAQKSNAAFAAEAAALMAAQRSAATA